jgi:hypothetical protein
MTIRPVAEADESLDAGDQAEDLRVALQQEKLPLRRWNTYRGFRPIRRRA